MEFTRKELETIYRALRFSHKKADEAFKDFKSKEMSVKSKEFSELANIISLEIDRRKLAGEPYQT